MLCGGLKSNGLADPFRNNEDDTFPEEQLPPPLQEHDPSDQPPRRPRNIPPAAQPQLALPFNPYMHLQHPLGHFYPGHALSNGHATYAGMPSSSQHAGSNTTTANAAAGEAAEGLPGLPLPRPLSRTGAGEVKAELASEAQLPSGADAAQRNAGTDAAASAGTAVEAQSIQQAGPMQYPGFGPQQGWAGGPQAPPFMVPPGLSAPVGTTGIMHRPLPYPAPSSLPSLFHPTGQPDAAALQALSGMHGGNFPLSSQAMPEGFPRLYYGAARLYAQHMAGPHGRAPGADAAMYGSTGFNPFMHMPFGANNFPGPQANIPAANSGHAAESGSAQAAESVKKRKTSGATQKRPQAGKSTDCPDRTSYVQGT